MKKLLTFTILSTSLLMLTGCSSTNHSETGEKYRNSETVQGLIYMAKGSQGDGPDDVTINITATKQEAGVVEESTLVPWTRTVAGSAGEKVSMTVKSLSSDGTVECQIMFQDIIIHNEAKGDHATVTCEGTLSLEK